MRFAQILACIDVGQTDELCEDIMVVIMDFECPLSELDNVQTADFE